MIEVKRGCNSISIHGHAGYAPHGQDIVCAAVSTLVQNMVISISEMTTDEIQYDMQPGSVEIRYGNLSADAQLLVSSFFIGIREISNEYPSYVQIVQA
jgi:uncharacterized protein YsxB (DUF464 family)